MNKEAVRKTLIGIAVIIVPFSSIIVGSYIIYKAFKKKGESGSTKTKEEK